jgi:hypothetical protein
LAKIINEADDEAKKINEIMLNAYYDDLESIKASRPALKKLLVARTLYTSLKKREIQTRFIEIGGLDAFA